MTRVGTFLLLMLSLVQYVHGQSTTGGRSGGSTASTGTGYLTPGKRPAETSAASMTIADEGSARGYMYVPPTTTPNRASSPDGSGSTKTTRVKSSNSISGPAPTNQKSAHQSPK